MTFLDQIAMAILLGLSTLIGGAVLALAVFGAWALKEMLFWMVRR